MPSRPPKPALSTKVTSLISAITCLCCGDRLLTSDFNRFEVSSVRRPRQIRVCVPSDQAERSILSFRCGGGVGVADMGSPRLGIHPPCANSRQMVVLRNYKQDVEIDKPFGHLEINRRQLPPSWGR